MPSSWEGNAVHMTHFQLPARAGPSPMRVKHAPAAEGLAWHRTHPQLLAPQMPTHPQPSSSAQAGPRPKRAKQLLHPQNTCDNGRLLPVKPSPRRSAEEAITQTHPQLPAQAGPRPKRAKQLGQVCCTHGSPSASAQAGLKPKHAPAAEGLAWHITHPQLLARRRPTHPQLHPLHRPTQGPSVAPQQRAGPGT